MTRKSGSLSILLSCLHEEATPGQSQGGGNLSRLGKQAKVPSCRTPDRALRDVQVDTGCGEWARGSNQVSASKLTS